MDKKYIVGIDFGFCNTAAWCTPIQGGYDGKSLCIRNAVHANEKICSSIVYRDSEGNYSLGRLPGSFSIDAFKSHPEKLYPIPERKNAFASFVRLIVQALIERNPEHEIYL